MKLLLALLFMVPVMALAATNNSDMDKIDAKWTACLDTEDGQSTQGSIACNMAAQAAADTILNKEYKGWVANLKKDNTPENQEILKRLVSAQRAWIAFRDADCSLSGVVMLGGSGENQQISGCLASATIKRVKDLREVMSFTE